MEIPGSHNFVYQISLVGQKQKPFRLLVQSPDGINSLPIVNIVDDIVFFSFFCGAHNAPRLIKSKQNLFRLYVHRLAAKRNSHAVLHPVPAQGNPAVDCDISRLNFTVRFATGANACFT